MLKEQVKSELLVTAVRQEYTPSVRVYDIRDYNPDVPTGVCIMGGFVAELMFTFTALYDWIQSNPGMAEFKFTVDSMERFITELMMNNDFAEGTCVIKVATDVKAKANLNSDDIYTNAESAVEMLKDPENLQSFGLKFLMQN